MFDESTWIGWTIGIALTVGVMTVGLIVDWSNGTIGGAFILALIVTIVIGEPLEARYRERHRVEPPGGA